LNRRGKYKADKDGGTEMWWGKMKKRGNNWEQKNSEVRGVKWKTCRRRG
jgi:hypothetical protein